MAMYSTVFFIFLVFVTIIDGRNHLKERQVRQLWKIIKQNIVNKFNIDNRHFYQHKILLFPDVAFQSLNNNNTWKIIVHGWKYENNGLKDWLKITTSLWIQRLTQHLINQNDNLYPNGSITDNRLQPFFVSDESYQIIRIIIGNKIELIRTDTNGQFYEQIEITNDDIQKFKKIQQQNNNVITYEAMSNDKKNSTGIIRLIEPNQGISIISDIDDTIKISEVFDKIRLLANTFIFPFKPVSGMSDLYQKWQIHNKNCTFHYLSSMPDQLYTLTQEFINSNNFPNGSFHMRHFRWAIISLFDFLHSQSTFDHKIKYLRFFLLNTIRNFVLIGDSGEKDPEIYGTITREYPERIRAIFIRAVNDESFDDQRFRDAFEGIPEEKWLIFNDPKQIPIDLSRAPRTIV
ncbi:unnamed protein product [Rotaria sp. Silwood1]|nr:unnamed protein product [Rotaria sp. Silwood1]CAF1566864.1 unnamed protein product [Rotaria sp. Silwood1]CAF3655228.1 unnamed protein product [Rotaria sp. Silwood1]CAF4747568.1 unnamed protein product [Rotaria sp. Silwood1]